MKIRNFDRKVRSDGRISVYYIIITRPGLCEVAITLRRETTRTGDEGRGRRGCALHPVFLFPFLSPQKNFQILLFNIIHRYVQCTIYLPLVRNNITYNMYNSARDSLVHTGFDFVKLLLFTATYYIVRHCCKFARP